MKNGQQCVKEGHYWPGHGENIYKEAIDISISTDTTREILYRYLHIQNNGPVEESTNLTHKHYVRNVENGEQISHSASVTVDRLDKFLQSGAQYFYKIVLVKIIMDVFVLVYVCHLVMK